MSSGKIIKAIACVLAVAIVIGVIGVVYKFTNGFNEDFKTFYVECDGEKILAENARIDLYCGVTYRFDVKYTFDSDSAETKEYSVKITSNPVQDFDFNVGEERYKYSKAKELSSVFKLKTSDTFFELTMPEELTLKQALASVYGDGVELPNGAQENNPYPYKLVVSSYNGKVQYGIQFRVVTDAVTDVVLSSDGIEFWEDDL